MNKVEEMTFSEYLEDVAVMTQAELAERIGSHRSTIHLYATGQRHHPQPKLVREIADVFGVTPGQVQRMIRREVQTNEE